MPWVIPLITLAAGVAQTAIQAKKAKDAQKALEDTANSYKPNQSIMDYYNEAQKRYNTNPSDSAFYKRNIQNINRQTSGALASLQSRRSAVAGLPTVLRAANDATLNTEVAAEGMKEARFGQLGEATGAKAQEEKYPFEMKYNLQALKAGAANQGVNTGISNAYSGLQGLGNYSMLNQYYGSGGTGRNSFGNTRYGQMYWGKTPEYMEADRKIKAITDKWPVYSFGNKY